MAKKHTYQYIKSYFKENDCILLSQEYKNNKIKLDYICSCGNQSSIKFGHFQRGHKCSKCGIKKQSNKIKHTYQYIQFYFKKHNCILLSKQYLNAHQKLNYICSCGNKTIIKFYSFRQGSRCNQCGIRQAKNTSIIRGHCLERTFKDDFDLYKLRVHSESGKVYRKHKSIINPKKLKRLHYHLDHKFSIFEGFKNNIPVFIMSSLHNLEMLTDKENRSKGRKSSITKEHLLELFYE